MPTLSFLPAQRPMTALLLLAGLSGPAMATIANPSPAPAPAPTPAPSSAVQGPPDGLIAPPSATQTRPSVIIRPTPAPTPAPAPVRTPTPAPVSTAPGNTPQRTPTARTPIERAPVERTPIERPVAERAPAVQPSLATPSTPPITPPAMPAPGATAPAPIPANPATDGSANVVPEATLAPPTAAPLPALPGWLPWAAGGGVLLLGLGAWQWRRRRKADAPAEAEALWSPPVIDAPRPKPAEQEPAAREPAAPTPAAPLPTAAATRTRTSANALGRRADLSLTLEPLSAQSTLVNLRLRYAVTVRNDGVIAAAPVAVRVGMFAGGQVHPQGIANWFTLPLEAGHHALPLLEAGEEYRFEGEMAAPLEALKPMEIEGRRIAIPLVAVDVRYGHAEGEAPIEGQTARAFVVGRDSGQADARLSPFRLDRGPGNFAPLGQRYTGIGHVA